jgi:translation initiation factor IF-3
MFRGREMIHQELGTRLLDQLAEDVLEIAKVETTPKLDGRNMTMVLAPMKEAVTQKAPTPPRRAPRPVEEVEEEAPQEEEVDEETSRRKPPKVTRAEGG